MSIRTRFRKLSKLTKGSKVAILSPSFAAPGRWPHVYELGLKRIREQFDLVPVEFPSTKSLSATWQEKVRDLEQAFTDPSIDGIITTLGGDIQVTYVKHLSSKPFNETHKPFFGISDNTHLINHLWLNGVPSYYGGTLFTDFAMTGEIDSFTLRHLNAALFEDATITLTASPLYSDIDVGWADPALLQSKRIFEESEGWFWDGDATETGITWGGCLESIDELLRHNSKIPSLSDFEEIVLFLETSEEIPTPEYVSRVVRAFGERGILERIRGVLVGRPKAWSFEMERTIDQKKEYRARQRETILDTVRRYNSSIPVVQNLDFGHSAPQLCLPVGRLITINGDTKEITVEY